MSLRQQWSVRIVDVWPNEKFDAARARAPDRTPFPRSTPMAVVSFLPQIPFASSNCPEVRSGKRRRHHASLGENCVNGEYR